MKELDLSPVDLLEVAEHAPKPYRDEAWTLFEQFMVVFVRFLARSTCSS